MLSKQTKKTLQQQAHHLNPTVIIGNKGLTPAVQQEIDTSLEAHELIKIKLPGGDRSARNAICEQIIAEQAAELIQTIGRIAVVYRKSGNN